MFTRFCKSDVRLYAQHRLRNAALFGQNLVVDLSFDNNMTRMETKRLAQQLLLAYSDNRYKFEEPYNLTFCNIDYSGSCYEFLEKSFPYLKSSHFFINMTTKPYLDLFPKEKLIYLTPNADESMIKYDHDAVYIIGGIVDKYTPEPLSYAKALRDNIKAQRLPIDEYVIWNRGSKRLCLNHTIAILNDVKNGVGWAQAFHNNIPSRKLKSPEEIMHEDNLRMEKFKRRIRLQSNNNYSNFVKDSLIQKINSINSQIK